MSKSQSHFPWKEYLGLCGLMIACGFAFSFTGVDSLEKDEQIQFFVQKIKKLPNSELRLVQRLPSLSQAMTTEQALIIISLTHAHRFEEASILVESMSRLQNPDGSWNLWCPVATQAEWNIQTDAIAWMVIAINQFQEKFNDYRFAPTAERAIRFIEHLKSAPGKNGRHWYRHSNKSSETHSYDLALIATALEYFRLRADGEFTHKIDAKRIRSELKALANTADEYDWRTQAYSILAQPVQNSIIEISKNKINIAQQCQRKSDPTGASRSIASISEKTTSELPSQNLWPLWLAAEIHDLPCDGIRLSHKIKQWRQENPSLEMIGNLEEIAWIYFAKNKASPLVF